MCLTEERCARDMLTIKPVKHLTYLHLETKNVHECTCFSVSRYYNCVPFSGCIMVGASSTCHSRVKTFEELPLEMTSHKTHHVRPRPQIYAEFIGWRMSTSAWFVCVYRTARQTVGWFWRQMSWRGLSTSTEGPCWKSRWLFIICDWLVFVLWSDVFSWCSSARQRAAAQSGSSALRPPAARHAHPSSANSQAKPSTTTSTASCLKRASATSSPPPPPRIRPAWQHPTCNSTDWPVISRPRPLTTNWTDV